jgi:site-specific recombinase XerD
MEADMKIAHFSESTRTHYLRYVSQFVAYHDRPPQELGRDEVRQWLVHLIEERGLSADTIRGARAAVRFLYQVTLNRPMELASLPVPRKGRRVPVVLSGLEVEQLLEAIRRPKYRAIAMAMYGAGLRISEACGLRVEHIDTQRMLLQFPGKGDKERCTLLSHRLLSYLRDYWRWERPTGAWLFPKQRGEGPLRRTGMNRVFNKAVQSVGFQKRVVPHTLRHSYATHLLELGTPLPVVQALLGHSRMRSTEVYLHVSREHLARTTSPLDVLGTPAAKILG